MRRVKSDSELAEVPKPRLGWGIGHGDGSPVDYRVDGWGGYRVNCPAGAGRTTATGTVAASGPAGAVLNAADDLLTERGFAGVTIEGIRREGPEWPSRRSTGGGRRRPRS